MKFILGQQLAGALQVLHVGLWCGLLCYTRGRKRLAGMLSSKAHRPSTCRWSAACLLRHLLYNSAGRPGAAAGWSAATAVCGVGVRLALLHTCLCQG
jgi:hypothetical protein